jgi:16S rRNA (adenine1518-N6/adenine1519-N6)-dimethyltransferase
LHRLGQHFLVDRRLCRRIAEAAGMLGQEACLEIGPGLGALTAALLADGRKVVAIELDRGLCAFLRRHADGMAVPLTIVEGDAREADLAALSPPAATVLVGNLPYYASAPLLRRTLEEPYPGAVLMLQREVAERLAAAPGTAGRGALTVLREATCDLERLFAVPPAAFYPRPEVASAVVRLRRRADALSGARYRALEVLLGEAFRYRRKGMRQALRHGRGLPPEAVERLLADAGVAPARRPESLALAEWLALVDAAAVQGGEGRCLPAAPVGS